MEMLDEKRIALVFERLAAANPHPVTELISTNSFTLLVAVVLSAQMTDKGVNRATGNLFAVADTPEKMVALGETGLLEYLKSINYYRSKARHVIALSRILIENFGSQVPGTREELESLPGVGRKTANVILNVLFDQATMPIDTHILRISPRMGLSCETTTLAVEKDLLRIIPVRFLKDAHHWLLLHGRYVCTAAAPHCASCCLNDICPRNGVVGK